jgi:hypothetical protein
VGLFWFGMMSIIAGIECGVELPGQGLIVVIVIVMTLMVIAVIGVTVLIE